MQTVLESEAEKIYNQRSNAEMIEAGKIQGAIRDLANKNNIRR
ncbi:hypothetical protein [Fictibacillus phosphorivorans]|nr:hypothetical protein [Fictibacillus phosphorivorans]